MPAPDRKSQPPLSLLRGGTAPGAEPEALACYFARVRERTDALTAGLSDEDCCVQSMADASPAKWHLGHTSWFFETFILERHEPDYRPFHDAFRVMFNSYYNGIGDKHPRAQRGLLTRPPLTLVKEYRRNVDTRMQRLLAARAEDEALQALVALGLNHEQQHQELVLTDIKHLLSMNPLSPAFRQRPPRAGSGGDQARPAWHRYGGGLVAMGSDGGAFCFDNELPRHRVFLESFELAGRLVTNAEYLTFVEQGAYRDARLWLSEGWDWVRANQLAHPIYWRETDGAWREFTLAGMQDLSPAEPAVHLSYFEADAYARWAGARLPTEAEWEHAAAGAPAGGRFADSDDFHPAAASPNPPGEGPAQLFGDAWEWTQSAYGPYPGYRQPPGAVGEYNGKFMVNQYVLRGGSCATPADHIRASYRNFFPATARWQFSGIRLARD